MGFVRLNSHMTCPLKGGGVKLGGGKSPAVLGRRDEADDESARRAAEGNGEEAQLVGGSGNCRGDGPEQASAAEAADAGNAVAHFDASGAGDEGAGGAD